MTFEATALQENLFRPYTADHEQLLKALPAAWIDDARQALEGELSSEDRLRIGKEMGLLLARTERNLEHWLGELDPKVLFYPGRLQHATAATEAGKYLREPGINRFAWVLGVAAKGERQDTEGLTHYFELCGLWMALSVVLAAASTKDHDLPTGFRSNEWREQVRRIMSVEVRTAWACELICSSFADAVASSDQFSALSRVTPESVRTLFEWLRDAKAAMDGRGSTNGLSGRIVAPVPASTILADVSTPSGSLSGQSFASLVFSSEIENGPVVCFDGEFLPVATRDAFTSLDLALFDLARRDITGKNATKLRSDLFELTVRGTVRSVVKNRFSVPEGEVMCTDPGDPDNEGETDFFFYDHNGFSYVGECKAMVAPNKAKAVLSAFSDQLSIAADQVAKRVERVRSSHPVTISGDTLTGPAPSLVRGLVTPLHSYAAAILDKSCLGVVLPKDADLRDMAIIPLHALTLLLSGIESGRILNDYLDYRGELLNRGVQIVDEMDAYISFLYAEGNTGVILSAIEQDMVPFLAQYSMDPQAVYDCDRPTSPEGWVEALKVNCRSR